MPEKEQVFMGQPLMSRRDYGKETSKKKDVKYDRYGHPVEEEEPALVVSPAEEKIIEEPDYDSIGKEPPCGMSLRCPFCGTVRGISPELLNKDTIVLCASCKGEVKTASVRRDVKKDVYSKRIKGKP